MMTQTSANIINYGASSKFNPGSFDGPDVANVFKYPLILAQNLLNAGSVKFLKQLGIAQRYVFVTPLLDKHDSDEQAFIRAYYDIVPERTHEDFQAGYKARMDRVKNQLHEYVDIDLPIVEDGVDW
jgi:hypothetical protein